MWNKWSIKATGCLNTVLWKQNTGCICSSMTILTQVLILFWKNLTRSRLIYLMRNSFPSQICFVPPSIVCVAFVTYTRLLLNEPYKNKISSFIKLPCHQKKQMNHRSTLEHLTLGNYVAMQLWENWPALLPWSWVSLSSASCVAVSSICTAPFSSMLNLVWKQFLETAVALQLPVSLVCPHPKTSVSS
jgi:hypothetical protein